MFKRSVFAAIVVLLSLTFAGSALADDLVPPPWQRGGSGTTFAMWLFGTNDTTPDPEAGWFNPNGMPEMTITPGPGCAWLPILEGREGVWPLSGGIEILIPNYPPPNPYKEIWIQLTWGPSVPRAKPFIGAEVPDVRVTANGQDWLISSELIRDQVLPGQTFWHHSVYKICIEPNPPWELIWINGSVYVDQIVIDTICVPEPGSFLALGTGLIGFVGFAMRRRSRK